jgi:hypothetical protein
MEAGAASCEIKWHDRDALSWPQSFFGKQTVNTAAVQDHHDFVHL